MIDYSPEIYLTQSVLEQINMWEDDFQAKPLEVRARRLAYLQLDNIINILRRHDEIQEQRLKDRSAKANKKGTTESGS